jgi:hypothetical protein
VAPVRGEDELRQEWLDLEARRAALDRRIAHAVHRQRHGGSPAEIERARDEEKSLVRELDRLMTRTRAVEGQLLQLRKAGRP